MYHPMEITSYNKYNLTTKWAQLSVPHQLSLPPQGRLWARRRRRGAAARGTAASGGSRGWAGAVANAGAAVEEEVADIHGNFMGIFRVLPCFISWPWWI